MYIVHGLNEGTNANCSNKTPRQQQTVMRPFLSLLFDIFFCQYEIDYSIRYEHKQTKYV